MARSRYVYVVHNTLTNKVLGAFTVKHELSAWLSGNKRLPATVRVTRVCDGCGAFPETKDMTAELMLR